MPSENILCDCTIAAGIDRSSPLGMFLRRCVACCGLMSYERTVALFTGLQVRLYAACECETIGGITLACWSVLGLRSTFGAHLEHIWSTGTFCGLQAKRKKGTNI